MRLLQESSGLMPQMGLAESSLVTEWVPGDSGNGSSAVGEAGGEWGWLPGRRGSRAAGRAWACLCGAGGLAAPTALSALCSLSERDGQLGCISRWLSQGIFVLLYIKVGLKGWET